MWSKVKEFFSRKEKDGNVRDVIEELIEDEDEGDSSLDPDEREMLANILELRDLTVEDVMIPRAEVIALKADASLDEVKQMFQKYNFKRIPVYTENLDDVMGYIDIRKLIDVDPKSFKLSSHLQKAEFIAPSMRVLDLLMQMRSSEKRMALVVDEYGGVDGLVSMGDIIEEIVGDIQDVATLNPKLQFFQRPDGVIVVDARMELEDLEEKIGNILSDEEQEEDLDTLGGLVCHLADRVPQRGELIPHTQGDIAFEIIESDPRHVKRIGIHGIKQSATQVSNDS